MTSKNLFFDYGKSYVSPGEINDLEEATFPEEVQWRPGNWLDNATGATPFEGTDIVIPLAGNVGWLNDISENVKLDEGNMTALLTAAKQASESDIILVAASGPMYTAAKAGVGFLAGQFNEKRPDIIFIGWNTNSAYHSQVFERLANLDFSLCIIEEDELALETSIAFESAKNLLQKKYGDAYAKKIYGFSFNTASSLCKELKEISAFLCIMDPVFKSSWNILAPSSLFSLAARGIDINAVFDGAAIAYMPDEAIWTPVSCADGGISKEEFIPQSSMNIKHYSALRNLLRNKGYDIEILVYSDIRFKAVAEWIKSTLVNVESGERKKIYSESMSVTNQFNRLIAYTESERNDFFVTLLSFEDYSAEKKEAIGDMEMDIIGKDLITKVARALRPKRIHILEAQLPNATAFFYGQLISFFSRSARLTELWK